MEAIRRGGMRPVVVALAFAVLTLAFDPRWLDFEVARRGLLIAFAGVLALVAALRRGATWCPASTPRGGVWLAALVAWHLVRVPGTENPWAGLADALWWIALAMVFWWGAASSRATLIVAATPALALLACYGLLQAAGLDWPAGYARPEEPVATLGNRNVAAEVGALGVALTALGVARALRRSSIFVLGAVLLLLAAWVGVLGSRGGFVAGAAALVVAAPGIARRHRALRGGVLAAALALGIAAAVLRPDGSGNREELPAGPDGAARPAPSTVAVRLEIWEAGLSMLADRPIFGHGTGQFRFEYPRYRTEGEIERTTFGRRFPTFAASAHDDPLELAIELGLPGLLLALSGLFVVVAPWCRPRRRFASLAPVVAFGLLALVRAPVGNAPAAALGLAWLGALASRSPGARAAPSRPLRLSAAGLGLVLVVAGTAMVAAECAVASWLRGGDPALLDLAVVANPGEPRYRSLRVVARAGGVTAAGTLSHPGPTEYAASREDLAALADLDPHNTNALLLTAELALAADDRTAAAAALRHALEIDLREPRAVLMAAVLRCREGHVAEGIAMLYAAPHPRLRERLAAVLQELAEAPALAGRPSDRALLEREAAFVRALDQVLARPGSPLANEAVRQFAERAGPGDDRARVLLARQLHALGRTAEAEALGTRTVALNEASRRLLAPVLDALSALPGWSDPR